MLLELKLLLGKEMKMLSLLAELPPGPRRSRIREGRSGYSDGLGAGKEYARSIGAEYGTLSEYRRVSKAFDIPARARLSWRHHRNLAPRDDRLDWLKRAVEEKWSVRKMQEFSACQSLAQ